MRYTLEKSEIYAEIKREMERYRDYAINKSEEEIKAIYVKYPRIKEIDMELKNAGAHMLKETLRRRGEDIMMQEKPILQRIITHLYE